ncbi:MAG: hypothetical protein LC792_07330 [Actinobacteria bacterium]|nr:hypothetical protein [Actinomycetota bacterium]
MTYTSGTPDTPDPAEAENVVASMASAVERVRRMAATVFDGDDALFADSEGPQSS